LNDNVHAAPPFATYSYWVLLLAIVGSYFWVHTTLGLGYPVPWPDEGSFLWPALSIQKHNTLLAPELNPYRPVMWFPPGYMIVQGLIFKVTGFSLQWARTLSAAYIMGGVALLAAVLGRLRHPFLNLLLCAVFLHSPIVWFVGNVARMESLVFLLASAGLLALQRGRIYVGLAVIALLPLIHANGLFFCLGAGGYFLVIAWRDSSKLRPSRLDVIVVGLALISWLLYAAYVFVHWEAFLNDMGYALRFKAFVSGEAGGILARVKSPGRMIPGILIAGGLIYATKVRLPALFLLVYAAPLFLLSLSHMGWPYDIYAAFMYLLLSVILLEVGTYNMAGALRLESGVSRRALALAAFLMIAGFDWWALRNLRLLSDTPTSSTVHLGGSLDVPYFTKVDGEELRHFLRSLESSGPTSVVFYPWGDALLFRDMESENLRLMQPTFYEGHADVQIVHQSRHIPGWVVKRMQHQVVSQQGIHRDLDQWEIIRGRDGTEFWRYNRRADISPPASERSR
jgi:hypothetical protein